jgi:hypothetical protein
MSASSRQPTPFPVPQDPLERLFAQVDIDMQSSEQGLGLGLPDPSLCDDEDMPHNILQGVTIASLTEGIGSIGQALKRQIPLSASATSELDSFCQVGLPRPSAFGV